LPYDHSFSIIITTFVIASLFFSFSSLNVIHSRSVRLKGWQVPLVIALVASAFAIWIALLGAEYLFLSLALGLGFAVGLLQPVVALSFFLTCLVLRPWEFMPQQEALLGLPRAGAMLCLMSLALDKLRLRDLDFRWTSELTAFVLLVIVLGLSALFSYNPNQGLSFLAEQFIPITVLTLLLLNGIRYQWEQEVVLVSLIIAVTGLLSHAIFVTLKDPEFIHGISRLATNNLLGNANDLAACIVIVLPFSIWFLLSAKSGLIKRLVALVSLPVMVSALWLSQSRGAMLGIFFALGLYLFFIRRKITLRSGIVVLLPLVFLLLLQRETGEVAASSSSRWNYVLAGFGMVKDNPVFGVGIGNYPHFYDFYTPQFLEWGARTAHSSWLLVLSEAGPVALLLFAAIILLTLRRVWRLRQRYPAYLIAFVGYVFAITFLSHTYLFLPYVVMALIITQSHLNARDENMVDESIADITESSTRDNVIPLRSAPPSLLLFLLLGGGLMLPISQSIAEGNSESCCSIKASPGMHKPFSQAPVESSLKLAGSRGEILHFLVKLEASQGCFPIGLAPWKKETNLTTRLFTVEYIDVKEPSYTGAVLGPHPDPLLPYQMGERLCIEGERWLVGEVEIPLSQKPGKYSTSLRFAGEVLGIELHVWTMSFPEEPAVPFYTEMTTWWNLLGHFGEYVSREAELSHMYHQLLRAHRLETLSPRIVGPKVEKKGGRATLNYKTHPDRERSFEVINLRDRPSWAYYGFPSVTREEVYKPETIDYFRGVEWAISDIGREGRAMVYLWDEPQKEEMIKVRDLARIAKRYSPSLRVMVTVTHSDKLDRYVDIFAPVMDQYDAPGFPPPEVYKGLQAQGKEVWWYVSCMSHGCMALADSRIPDVVIERPSAYIRSISWLTKRYGIDAFLYYHTNYAYQFYPQRDPWDSQWDFSGNGDGTLVYPGRPGERGFEEHTAVASLRLKLMRESSQDAEYIRWMEELETPPEWWQREYHALAKNTREWERSYQAYEQLRIRAGDYLNSIQ